MYGLAVEHYQAVQVQWNGNGGADYFYQSEMPYDPPSQSAWMDGSSDGYPSIAVSDSVTSFQAYGLGVYCYFDVTRERSARTRLPHRPHPGFSGTTWSPSRWVAPEPSSTSLMAPAPRLTRAAR